MMKKMKALLTEEQGQGMTEYGLVLAGIAVVVVAAVVILKDKIGDIFDSISTSLTSAISGS
ncbi:Flp family type IVb pilin [Priestia megaterium]|jgi:pilus assembly protein Flp/PilA|uniref:Flp family type IVb pilin n=1 Tax=Priestia megaterium TaxID=1404 RepID=A0A6H1P0V1_PRIMG|nr:Flp family type IVb pilin [Priestia megaterium]QIZ07072.1 Flp family type IVb pilin [Priestia megaterium]